MSARPVRVTLTSSNFLVISENALKMAVVEPDTVTMRSGHEPSDMLMIAPDWFREGVGRRDRMV